MNTNKIIGLRFERFFRYLRNISIISFIAFLILNAINTGNNILYWINYVLLMIAIVGSIQSVILYVLSKYYINKK